jgi:subfamily B ATP-binding cassette protein MsbA
MGFERGYDLPCGEHGMQLSRGSVSASPSKPTVMSLTQRLYEVGSGQILCDGTVISTVSLASLRQKIAYVAQENFLFKGSPAPSLKTRRSSFRTKRPRR